MLNLIKRRCFAALSFLSSKALRKKLLHELVANLYAASQKKKYKIPSVSIESLLSETICKVSPQAAIDGNLSYKELIVISSIVAKLKPKNILEIGTFNGLTTLHLAINSSDDCKIATLDLLSSCGACFLDKHDIQYVDHKGKHKKHYSDFVEKEKINEHFGNSLDYPFKIFGGQDLIFIDGGHSYNVVKNDTEKALNILSDNGVILWHDYSPNCPGVFKYLNELASMHSIVHIEGTSLALLIKKATLKT